MLNNHFMHCILYNWIECLGEIFYWGIGSYLIQISACQWIEFADNVSGGVLRFVKLEQDFVNGESITLSRQTDGQLYEIFENKLVGNELKEFKGKWTIPSQSCEDYRSGSVFRLSNTNYFGFIADCRLVQFNADKHFIQVYNLIETKHDPIEGEYKLFQSTDNKQAVRLFKTKAVSSLVGNSFDLEINSGQWQPFNSEFFFW